MTSFPRTTGKVSSSGTARGKGSPDAKLSCRFKISASLLLGSIDFVATDKFGAAMGLQVAPP